MSRFAWSRRPRVLALLGCAIAAQLVALQLVLRTPWIYDDSPNQDIKGYIHELHMGFWEFIRFLTEGQWHAIGRFAPVGLAENYGLQYVLHDRVAYKIILILFTIVAIALVARVLVVMRVPAEIAILGSALTAPLFQLHNYHDSLTAYSGLMQMVTILYCLSLLCFIGFLRREGGWVRWALLALSMLLVLTADLTYEAAYLLAGFHVAVAYAERRSLLTAIGPVLISVAFIGLTLWLRATQVESGSQYSINAAPGDVLPAFGKQLAATLPGATFLDAGGPRSLPDSGSHVPELRGLLIAALLLPVLYAAARTARTWRPAGRLWIAVLAIAVTLLALPASTVSLAVRYQAELRWGVGYLPVFYGVAAVGVLAALGYALLARKLPALPLAIVVAILAGVAGGAAAEGNTRIVTMLEPVATARDQLDEALAAGVLDDVPEHELLLFNQTQIAPPAGFWIAGYGMTMSQWVYTRITREYRSAELANASPLAEQCPATPTPGTPCPVLEGPATWWTTGVDGTGTRWILLTPLAKRTLKRKDDLFVQAAGPTARLAVRTTDPAKLKALGTAWYRFVGARILANRGPLRQVRQRDGWTFLDVPLPKDVAASTGVVGGVPPGGKPVPVTP